jgi:hypothetical protein
MAREEVEHLAETNLNGRQGRLVCNISRGESLDNMSPSELLGLPKMLVFVTVEHTYKITDA